MGRLPARGAEIGLFKRPPSGAIDEIDFRLLSRLSLDPGASHDDLARSIGRSASAVRKRLANLREEGVLQGFVAYPTAGAFDRVAVGASWDTPVSIKALLELEDTVYAADAVDDRAGALAYTHDPEAWRGAAEALAGAVPTQVSLTPAPAVPPLGPLEWRVAAAMIDHPRGTLRDLSAASGLAPRTVRARREKLLACGAVVIEPLIRPSRTGALAFHVNVKAPRDAWAAAREALGETIVVSDYRDSLYLFCRAPDLTTQTARLAATRRVPGVERIDVVLHREFRLATERIHGWIEDELAKWRRASA